MFAAAATSLAQTPSVTFLGMDTTTLGNWKGVYGQDGFILSDFGSMNNPPYTNFNGVNANLKLLDIWSCSDGHTCDPRELNKQPFSYTSAERVESYYYQREWDDFQVNTFDNATHRIALYFCDYEFYGRQVQVIAHNTNTGAVLDTRLLSNYSGGVYLIYNYTGNVDFEIVDNITPTTKTIPNGTISGFFWGGSGGPPTPAPSGPVVNFSPLGVQSGATVSGTVPIQVSLVDSPGVTSVQLQLDGLNLGAPMTYFVTDALAQPVILPFNYNWDTTAATNCSHTITAVATDANGYVAVSPNLMLTVNNGSASCGSTPPPAAAPTFSPVAGSYASAQMVSLNTATSGASIRYTTDGSTPTETVGTLWTGTPTNISSNTTIRAIAFKTGIPDSTVSSATYTISTGGGGGGGSGSLALVQSNATGTSNPGNISQSVAFSSSVTSGNTIVVFVQYYNTAVTATPSDNCGDRFTIASAPVTISGSGTAQWFAAPNVFGGSCTVSVGYSSPTSYGGVAIFEVSGLGSSAAVDQSGSGTGNGTLALASISPTQQNSFAIAQVWSAGGGGINLGGNWTVQERTRFSTIYQSNLAGWQISNSFAPLSISAPVGGGPWIAMVANLYAAGGSPPPSQVATPTFSPAAGAYIGPVTISTTTSGATIRYTTDGSTPSETNGTVFSTSITLTSNTTIKAIAYKSGMTDSNVASAAYTFAVATPTFSPAPGAYSGPVSIGTTTSGATIRYTIDGSAPTETNGTVYVTPVTLTSTTTLKAVAYKTGFTDSTIASGTYTIGSTGFNPALIQSWASQSSAPGNSSQSVTFQSGVTSGNTIFVFAQYYNTAVTATATDNCNDTFTQITGSPAVYTSPGVSGTAHWFIARNVAGGTCTVKVTYSSPTNYGGLAVFEVSGLGGLNVALDQFASGTGSSTSASTSITPIHSASFAIAQLWSDGGGGLSLGSGWTTQERTRFSTLYQSNLAGWQILSSTGPVSVSASVGGGPWIALIANFYVP